MKDLHRKEFGDFQTPKELARLMMNVLQKKNFSPEIIVEPTCGLGSVLLTADAVFKPKRTLGIEIQKEYVAFLAQKARKEITVLHSDFFYSLQAIKNFISDDENILFVGNPPWVTNAELSLLDSANFPKKSNFDSVRGIEAITGKSNFDISEYIIQTLIDTFCDKKAIYAFLCKTSVAKKIMNRLWKKQYRYNSSELYPIDSKKYFNAAVDACLFVLDFTEKKVNSELDIFISIENRTKRYTSGYVGNVYLEDMSKKKYLDIYGKSQFIWRNGIKHDCAKVMELKMNNFQLFNGYDEIVTVESDLLYPYLKSSDLVKERIEIKRKILVTQRYINEPTEQIKMKYPKAWKYLNNHEFDFEKRKSIVYKNKGKFSLFSVGDYTFKPYKIAISGLYKSLNFKLIYPSDGKPVLLDDTCNFISFDNENEALFVFSLLKHEIVICYLNSRISWEAKRPIKTEILNSIDFAKVADRLAMSKEYHFYFGAIARQNVLFA